MSNLRQHRHPNISLILLFRSLPFDLTSPLTLELNHSARRMSSCQLTLPESKFQQEYLGSAPEGLPNFRKLLDLSAVIKGQLGDERFKYLKPLAAAWASMEKDLTQVGSTMKVLRKKEGDIFDEMFIEQLLEGLSGRVIAKVFAHDPAGMRPAGTSSALLPPFENAIGMMWKEHADPLRLNLVQFWDLWPDAREDVITKGLSVRRRYEPFLLTRRMLLDLELYPDEPIFGSDSFSEVDAQTICSELSGQGQETEYNFESATVIDLLNLVKARAAQGHDLHKLLAHSATDVPQPSCQSEETGSAEISISGERQPTPLDVSLLRDHLPPQMRRSNPRLIKSLANGYRVLKHEADVLQKDPSVRTRSILDLAQAIRTLSESMAHYSEQDVNSNLMAAATSVSAASTN